jgi:hypothetical protein
MTLPARRPGDRGRREQRDAPPLPAQPHRPGQRGLSAGARRRNPDRDSGLVDGLVSPTSRCSTSPTRKRSCATSPSRSAYCGREAVPRSRCGRPDGPLSRSTGPVTSATGCPDDAPYGPSGAVHGSHPTRSGPRHGKPAPGWSCSLRSPASVDRPAAVRALLTDAAAAATYTCPLHPPTGRPTGAVASPARRKDQRPPGGTGVH